MFRGFCRHLHGESMALVLVAGEVTWKKKSTICATFKVKGFKIQ
jgi:hypothetical protein